MMSKLEELTAADVILRILDRVGTSVNSTKLVKLTYLVDYLHYQHYGSTLTGFQYMWDHYGPNALGHAIISEARKLSRQGLVTTDSYPSIYGGDTVDFTVAQGVRVKPLPPHAEMLVEDVVSQYSSLSLEQITEVSKQTQPFRSADQYSLLVMEQLAPAGTTTESDWDAYQRDLEENGSLSLEDVKRRYGIE